MDYDALKTGCRPSRAAMEARKVCIKRISTGGGCRFAQTKRRAGVPPAAVPAAKKPCHYQEFFRPANVLRPGWPQAIVSPPAKSASAHCHRLEFRLQAVFRHTPLECKSWPPEGGTPNITARLASVAVYEYARPPGAVEIWRNSESPESLAGTIQPKNRSWGSRPPRAWLDAPRVQQFVADLFLMRPDFSVRSMFSARARSLFISVFGSIWKGSAGFTPLRLNVPTPEFWRSLPTSLTGSG
jgi:hypothetical protein